MANIIYLSYQCYRISNDLLCLWKLRNYLRIVNFGKKFRIFEKHGLSLEYLEYLYKVDIWNKVENENENI